MPGDFISFNSWTEPGTIYQAADPVEVIEGDGSPGEWLRLQAALARWRAALGTGVDQPHPAGGAAGFFRYDGSFRFAIYPRFEVFSDGRETALWRDRRRLAPEGPVE